MEVYGGKICPLRSKDRIGKIKTHYLESVLGQDKIYPVEKFGLNEILLDKHRTKI